MSKDGRDPELTEAAWQAWLTKNEAQDKLALERRIRVMGFAALLVMAGVVLWNLIKS